MEAGLLFSAKVDHAAKQRWGDFPWPGTEIHHGRPGLKTEVPWPLRTL